MPAYHSNFLNEPNVPLLGIFPCPLHHPKESVNRAYLIDNPTSAPASTIPIFVLILPAFLGNIPLQPLRTRTRGPAYTLPPLSTQPDPSNPLPELDLDPDSESYDQLDEILSLFRANTLFRNFEIKGPADRLLIYGILFVSECLGKVRGGMTRGDAQKVLTNTALDSFSIPGDAGFPLNQAFEAPSSRQDAETLRQYLSQVRQELAIRLLARLYADGDMPSKWWLSFSRRKFMGKSL